MVLKSLAHGLGRDFSYLWGAQAVSALGSRLTRTALPVVAITSLASSAFEVALLSALSAAPGAVVGLLAGGKIDRSLKRPLLMAADWLRAALVLALAAAVWLDATSMPLLYAVGALMGLANSLFQITDNAYLPSVVKGSDLMAANARLEGTESVAEISGPALAGVLIDWLTAPAALVADALSYIVSALLLGRIRASEPLDASAPDKENTVGADLREGLKAVWGNDRVRPLLLTTAVLTLSWGFFLALYMIYVLQELQLPVAVVGAIIGVGGLGGLAGAMVSSKVSSQLGLGRSMIACCAAATLSALLIPLAHGSLAAIVACLVAHQLLGDGFLVAYEIQSLSLIQSATPQRLLARANAVFTTIRTVALPVGALVAGVLAERWGLRPAVTLGVLLGVVAPLGLLPLRKLKTLQFAP